MFQYPKVSLNTNDSKITHLTSCDRPVKMQVQQQHCVKSSPAYLKKAYIKHELRQPAMGNAPHASRRNNNVDAPFQRVGDKRITSLSVRLGEWRANTIIPGTHLRIPSQRCCCCFHYPSALFPGKNSVVV